MPSGSLPFIEYVHDWNQSHHIPAELADARETAKQLWDKYIDMIDGDYSNAEKEIAYKAAMAAEEVATGWYVRWQKLGGTSDIKTLEMIVA